jgi:NTE family protein
MPVYRAALALFIVGAMSLLLGCAKTLENTPLQANLSAPTLVGERSGKADDTFIVLAFSGGGTRSAAFSYGVLEAFRDTEVTDHGRQHRLLDQVDVITAVSGGSYTAAYYGLFGDKVFTDYEGAFLKRDVQGELISQLANPAVLVTLATTEVNRSDVAAQWLDRNVFRGGSFADMQRAGGPFVIINASDINTGTTFSFIQPQFDFLCSSISDFPVARAVMASSAVPGYFAPLAVRNHDTGCAARDAAWVRSALAKPDIYSRNYPVARALERYQDPTNMPVVRLVDGGITDNLGVRGSMMSPVLHHGDVEAMRGAFDDKRLDKVQNVLVVIANAQIYEDYTWSRKGLDPGLIAGLSASFDAGIGILNNESLALAKRGFEDWAMQVNRRPSRAGKPPVKVHFAALTFDQISNEDERRYFNAVPTALSLPSQQVDEVRALARRLLSQSREFRSYLDALRHPRVPQSGF